jgi:hypothetical protein
MSAMPARDDGADDYVSSAFRRENVAFEGSADEIEAIAETGARGAMAVAGLAVATLLAIWLAFFLFIYLQRGIVG